MKHVPNYSCDQEVADAEYIKAIGTRYRLENWDPEDLEAYCGIYPDQEKND